MKRTLVFFLMFGPLLADAQSGNAAAGLAGVGAGAALGTGAGQNASTPSSLNQGSGAGSGTAPIEIQIMAHDGLRRLAANIATEVKTAFGCNGQSLDCPSLSGLIIEDNSAAAQIGYYQAVVGALDRLTTLHSWLQDEFSLAVTPASITFPLPGGATQATVTLSNNGAKPLSINGMVIGGSNSSAFTLGTAACRQPGTFIQGQVIIPPNSQCTLNVAYTAPPPTEQDKTLVATLTIPNPDKSPQVVQLGATIKGVKPADQNVQTAKPLSDLSRDDLNLLKKFQDAVGQKGWSVQISPSSPIPAVVNAPAAGSTGSGASTGGTAATTPLGLTYLSDISTVLGGIKSGISYSPSTVQPTVQTFQVMLEESLLEAHIMPFGSTSSLNLQSSSAELSNIFTTALAYGNDINNWTTLCKAGNGTAQIGTASSPAPAFNPECNRTDMAVNLAIAAQVFTSLSTILQTANDGNGNPVLLDVLRGSFLVHQMQNGIPSIQVNIAAAAGSTRTNSFFLLNLFYTPKPSYNSGVIATFEIRDGQNKLLKSGARTVLFDYTSTRRLAPDRYDIGELSKYGSCGSLCRVVASPKKKHDSSNTNN